MRVHSGLSGNKKRMTLSVVSIIKRHKEQAVVPEHTEASCMLTPNESYIPVLIN